MSELIVFAFDNVTAASQMADEIKMLSKQQLINVSDAAVVVRKPDGKAKVKQATSLVGAGAMGGAFWGMLIGLLFFMPWLGLAIGAATGAIAGKFSDYGIDDDFINQVRDTIQPGHSALFLMVGSMTDDKVIPELKKFNPTILRTNLSTEDEAKLKEAFGVEE